MNKKSIRYSVYIAALASIQAEGAFFLGIGDLTRREDGVSPEKKKGTYFISRL
jgi:hypothetical protein